MNKSGNVITIERSDNMLNFIRAIFIALMAHFGQVNEKDGRSYYFHILGVTAGVRGISTKTVAVLHDVIEDADYSIEDFRFLDGEQREALNLVTHYPEDSYEEYVEKIKSSPMATEIKLSDLRNNMSTTKKNLYKSKDYEKLDKYRKAYKILTENSEVNDGKE